MNSHPIGAFIRPVGPYSYCMKLVRVVEDQWQLMRYGMTDGEAVKDGHQSMFYLRGLRNVLPGVWKDENDCFHGYRVGPLYYRLMRQAGLGQMNLF